MLLQPNKFVIAARNHPMVQKFVCCWNYPMVPNLLTWHFLTPEVIFIAYVKSFNGTFVHRILKLSKSPEIASSKFFGIIVHIAFIRYFDRNAQLIWAGNNPLVQKFISRKKKNLIPWFWLFGYRNIENTTTISFQSKLIPNMKKSCS